MALPAPGASAREVIEHLSDGYYEVDLRGCFTAVNDALCRIHGYPRESLLGMNNREYASPAVAREAYRVFNQVYRTGDPVKVFNHEIVRSDGSIRILDASVHLILDARGAPTGFRGIVRDVTEQKHNEAYERARTRLLERIARDAPLAETLAMVLVALEAQMPETPSALMLLQDGGLECAASRGQHPEVQRTLEDPAGPLRRSVCLRSACDGARVVVEGIASEPALTGWRDVAQAAGIRALWVEPVTSAADEVLGLLLLFPRLARGPESRELGWLKSATATAEIALSHQRITGELAYLGQHDALTGLLNRRSFLEAAGHMVALARRKNRTPGLLYMDLDRFKPVNDNWGHHAGDRLLEGVSRRLRRVLREGDSLARLGGDEFALLAPDLDARASRELANRIVELLHRPFDLGVEAPVRVGVSIGIAFADEPAISTDALLARADAAMYDAKSRRSGWAFYDSQQHGAAREVRALEHALRDALAGGTLRVHYQPVRDLYAERWIGVEALARMPGTHQQRIDPGRFVPVAEGRGLIEELDAYVLDHALEETRGWPGWVSVNVSPHSLQNPEWPGLVEHALGRWQRQSQTLVLEVTERVLPDLDQVAVTLEALARLGVIVALDDFGAGYSSLRYLRRLAVRLIKVDAGFAHGLGTGARNEAMVQGILRLAESLELRAVAQGVESAAAVGWLRAHGCRLCQGHALAAPAAWEDLALGG